MLGKRLVFQPTVKTHVEEGFFDDWPKEIIKEYKLKVSRKKRKKNGEGDEQPEESPQPNSPVARFEKGKDEVEVEKSE